MTLRELLKQSPRPEVSEDVKELQRRKAATLIAANKQAAQKVLQSTLQRVEQNSSISTVNRLKIWI